MITPEILDIETKKYNTIYYHYTTVKALYKIVTGKSLWLTSLSSANDSKELYYTKQEFINTFNDILTETQDSDYKDFLINWNKNINIDKINTYNSKYYALSLTDKRNNLTHWRSYGNDCSGICLGINLGVFQAYSDLIQNDSIGKILQINEISYTEEDKKIHIKEMLKIIYDIIKDKEIDYEFLTNTLYSNILPFIKTNFFYDEREVRILFNSFLLDFFHKFPLINSSKELLEIFNLVKTKYKDMGNEIRSYKELSLTPIWCKSIFPEIILGPHSYQNIQELRDFLDAYGLSETKISISEVPIR